MHINKLFSIALLIILSSNNAHAMLRRSFTTPHVAPRAAALCYGAMRYHGSTPKQDGKGFTNPEGSKGFSGNNFETHGKFSISGLAAEFRDDNNEDDHEEEVLRRLRTYRRYPTQENFLSFMQCIREEHLIRNDFSFWDFFGNLLAFSCEHTLPTIVEWLLVYFQPGAGDVGKGLSKSLTAGLITKIKDRKPPECRCINDVDDRGYTALWYAASGRCSEEVMRVLLELGADPTMSFKNGLTPLHGVNSVEKLELLLQAGAHLDVRDHCGRTPLHQVVLLKIDENKHSSLMQRMFEEGADPNARDNNSSTPLHLASMLNRRKYVIKQLINAGADGDAQNDVGDTPFHWARVSTGEPSNDVINALLADGATPPETASRSHFISGDGNDPGRIITLVPNPNYNESWMAFFIRSSEEMFPEGFTF